MFSLRLLLMGVLLRVDESNQVTIVARVKAAQAARDSIGTRCAVADEPTGFAVDGLLEGVQFRGVSGSSRPHREARNSGHPLDYTGLLAALT